MIGRTNVNGGGLDINGIIEEYKVDSGGNISAGDFVSFINEMGTDTQLVTRTNSGDRISAVALSENKVFIAHGGDDNYYLYGLVCTISGTTITAGTDTLLKGSYTNEGKITSVVLLSENKVFIAHSLGTIQSSSSTYSLYGLVCTISGTTITTGTDTLLEYYFYANASFGTSTLSAVALNENKVFIAFPKKNGTNYFSACGLVCTISGTTITVGNTNFFSSNISYYVSAVVLSENKVFIAHSYNNYLYGTVCTISGTTITAGTDTQLSTVNYTGMVMSAVALNENKVFIAHGYNTTQSGNYLYGIVCNISNTTIMAGTDTQLVISNNSGNNKPSAVLLRNNKVFIAFAIDTFAYMLICTISGTTIMTGKISSLSSLGNSYTVSAALLDASKVFVTHRHMSNNLYSIISQCNITNNVDYISGVAKDSGTAGDTIDVYTPNYS